MIVGIGIDLIEVARIESAVERFGDRFLQRILHPAEVEYCRSHRRPGPHLAARFAAKEALSKAFGTGIGAELGWQEIEVRHHPSGQPYLVLHGRGEELRARRGIRAMHLSLSHTAQHATAVAVLEADTPGSGAGGVLRFRA